MGQTLKVVGISGSLRKDSVNKKLLDFVATQFPNEVEYKYVDYSEVPLFNQDTEMPIPIGVKAFKEQVETADIVIFATPEYNGSIPGVLKNGIDWLTRPTGHNSLTGKVAGIIGASPGQGGTIKAQLHLREILSHVNMDVPGQPRVMCNYIKDKLTEDGDIQLEGKELENVQKLNKRLIEMAKAFKKDEVTV
ncbi:NADPH-dependent FMN reductase [Tenuibacillus multivorans]|uniref:Chromate reductase n=1 Tax=Tenuibacillus multivorans TaxID=237069 RepID=A0A1H0AW91_9BACI|nr:NAD(P)H-dependent oxidoreductase [Tenuibacillus multivorans]GEL77794.1 NADPH-dependent oxidoreductase [Tenuibacillus multivorans]SDN37601.1 chromate reductase [Tenuibacillus multivorans]